MPCLSNQETQIRGVSLFDNRSVIIHDSKLIESNQFFLLYIKLFL